MQPVYVNATVRTRWPDCGAVTSFEPKTEAREYGSVLREGSHTYGDRLYSRLIFRLMRCASCGRGGLAKIHYNGNDLIGGILEEFLPVAIVQADIPSAVPSDIAAEYREAERCASFGAWRAASAMLRSTLEKVLKANGYTKGDLKTKIDQAAGDAIISAVLREIAHNDIRVLGNDVLHDAWREVTPEEVLKHIDTPSASLRRSTMSGSWLRRFLGRRNNHLYCLRKSIAQ